MSAFDKEKYSSEQPFSKSDTVLIKSFELSEIERSLTSLVQLKPPKTRKESTQAPTVTGAAPQSRRKPKTRIISKKATESTKPRSRPLSNQRELYKLQEMNLDEADSYFTFNYTRSDTKTLLFYISFIVLFITVHIIEIMMNYEPIKLHAFFTTVSFLTVILWLGFSIMNIITKPLKIDPFWQILRVLHILAFTLSTFVSLIYWGAISWVAVPNMSEDCRSVAWCWFSNLVTHATVTVPPWVLLFKTLTEVYLIDIFWPIGFGVFYNVFIQLPVTLRSEEAIYPMVTFRDFLGYVVLVSSYLVISLIFLIGYWVSRRTRRAILGRDLAGKGKIDPVRDEEAPKKF